MRICYLADWQSIHTQRWLRYFVDRGHEVFLISNRPQRCRELEGIALYDLMLSKWEGLKMRRGCYRIYMALRLLKLKVLLKKIRPDILHAHYVSYYGWWGAKSGFHPFVLTAWGGDIYRDPNESQDARVKVMFALKRADLITSDNEDLRKATIELGAPSDINYVIGWGVDTSKFKPGIDSSDVRQRLNLGDSPVVLSTRSFKPFYNIDIIIMAIPLVLERVPNAKFILNNYFGYEDEKMRRLVKELGVEEAVRFVGRLDHSEMPKYYNVADVFVSVPSFDATSVSLLEAMACGVSPVVSDLDSVKEWIKDGENGYIVPVRDHKALAEAIVRLLKDGRTRELFATRNVALIKERADHYKHMERMEELYFSLLQRS